ncbi:MAG: hypothetical protein KDA60_02610 [Planctomycetales bacterium]|nr:hypothetical protein [Planctomycetales bacterium]
MAINAELLRELHRILRQLRELQNRLERGPRQIQVGETNASRLEAAVAEAKEQLKRTEMTVRDKELQLKEREGRIADLKAKLNSCSTNREYQAIVEQIAADDQANSVLSDEILELLEKSQADQDAIQQAEERHQKGKAELERIRKRVEDERSTLETDVTRLSAELKESEKRLPGDFRADYQRMVKAHGDEALAPLEGEVCGGCYQMVTPQMHNELRLERLVLCKSCGRVLYLPEDTTVS